MAHVSTRQRFFSRASIACLIATVSLGACNRSTDITSALPADPETRVPVVATMEALGPTSFYAVVGEVASSSIAVRMRDGSGAPMVGVPVKFELAYGSGTLDRVESVTDSGGVASAGRWILAGQARLQWLTATSGSVQPVKFEALALPGPVKMVKAIRGDSYAAVSGGVITERMAVLVLDSLGNPIPGKVVTFAPAAGSGTIDSPKAVTDASGIATGGFWTVGQAVGSQHLVASVDGAEAEFTATVTEIPCAEDCGLGGGQIAFVRDDQIFRVRPDGSDLQQLTREGKNSDPALSPDGRRIAFASDRGRCCDLYVMNADGSNVVRRTTGIKADNLSSPTWSPDGRRIAFSALRNGDYSIVVVDADDAASPEKLIGFSRGYNVFPAWSPDGRIAWTSDWAAYDFVFDLYVMNADGSDIKQLTSGFAFNGNILEYHQPAWSPDGTSIAFTYCHEQRNYCQESSIAVMNADGSRVRVVRPASGFAHPSWSPSGRRLVFSDAGCLYAIKLDGSEMRSVVCNATSPAWGVRPE